MERININNEEANRLIDAVKTIKEICEATTDCGYCPFDDGFTNCLINNEVPKNWDIDPTVVVKILK